MNSIETAARLKSQSTWRLVFLSLITQGIYTSHYIKRQTRILNEHLDKENKIAQGFVTAILVLSYLKAITLIVPYVMVEKGHPMEMISDLTVDIARYLLIVRYLLVLIWAVMASNRMNVLLAAAKGQPCRFNAFWTLLFPAFYFDFKINKLNDRCDEASDVPRIPSHRRNLGMRIMQILGIYLFANLMLFLLDPYSSSWHYHSKDPTPLQVVQPQDSTLSIDQITAILDAIDLAYEAREPNRIEKAQRASLRLLSLAFFPSTYAIIIKDFIDYLGPATPKQHAFTLSVKQRYNHLARLAVSKGMKRDGYLFQEEPSEGKLNGEPFTSLR